MTSEQLVSAFVYLLSIKYYYHITQARISYADKIGEFCYKNQNDSDVWFLEGALEAKLRTHIPYQSKNDIYIIEN
ncbi:MAG TPA: hypothetical protein VFY68_06185, partial [Nitrososphaeraceae archaeon]|nr:hypothetical protein [Nitrososphaeraceae archaeon]